MSEPPSLTSPRASPASKQTSTTCHDGDDDVVLCHNLIQYVDDITGVFRTALASLRSGGLFSVMAINRHSAPLTTAIRQTDPVAALAVLDEPRTRARTFDATLGLHTAEEITSLLEQLGCPVTAHYGIRAICDSIADDERKHDPDFSGTCYDWSWP